MLVFTSLYVGVSKAKRHSEAQMNRSEETSVSERKRAKKWSVNDSAVTLQSLKLSATQL